MSNQNNPLEDSKVVYWYEWYEGLCKETNAFRVGNTAVTIEKIKQNTSKKKLYANTYNQNINESEMVRNTSAPARLRQKKYLITLDALMMKDFDPPLMGNPKI